MGQSIRRYEHSVNNICRATTRARTLAGSYRSLSVDQPNAPDGTRRLRWPENNCCLCNFPKYLPVDLACVSRAPYSGPAVGVVRSSASVSDDEADAEMFQFLQSGEQVGYRSSPAVQSPYHNHVDLSSPCGFHQLLPHLPLGCTGADFLHLQGDGPTTPRGIFAHGAILHGQRLLILSGDAGIEAGANHFGGLLPLAENPPGFPAAGPLFYGHFTMLPARGRRLSFSAMRDSS